MIEYLAAHKLALIIGVAALSLALVLRHKAAASTDTSLPAYATNPYSSTPPPDGGSLALPYLGPPAGAGSSASTGDSGGTSGEGTSTSTATAAAGIADASTSTGPGAGPTLAQPISYGGPPIMVNDTPATATFVSYTGQGYEQSGPGSDYYVPVPISEAAPTSNVHKPGVQL